MWKLAVVCVVLGIMNSEGVDVRRRYVKSAGGYAGSSSYAGSGAGGYAGGYVGGFAGTGIGSVDDGFISSNTDDYDDYDPTGYYAPDFGLSAAFLDPYVFHQQLTAQIQAQNAAHQNYVHRQIAAQNAYFDGVRRRTHFGNGGYNTYRYAPSYAAASGSVGLGGSHQTAIISPANPAIPNVVNRFSTSSGPGGYKGVSVSSYSSSADVNGKRTSVRGAQTTVNDNGKITSYSVHS